MAHMAHTILFRISRLPLYDCRELKTLLHTALLYLLFCVGEPLTEISTRGYLLGGKGGRCVRPNNLPHSCAECLEILGVSIPWRPKVLSRPV